MTQSCLITFSCR